MKEKLAVTYRKVDALIPYVGNSRTHSEEQVAQIAASIREFGFTNPILTDGEDGIIAGHGRLMAARKLAMDEVPTIELAGLTAAQKRAYVIADNQLALNAGWDMATLANEFHALNEAEFDLGLTGFSPSELGEMITAVEELDSMPAMPSGDKEPFQQKTFTLHDDQSAIVDDAVTLARANPLADTGLNENGNGNALALICLQWLEHQNG